MDELCKLQELKSGILKEQLLAQNFRSPSFCGLLVTSSIGVWVSTNAPTQTLVINLFKF